MIAFVLLLLLLLPAGARAFEPETAGYAGVHDLGTKNAAVLGWNPALLSAHRGFRMSFELPSFGAALANNSFTSKYWNDHFARSGNFHPSNGQTAPDQESPSSRQSVPVCHYRPQSR